MNPLNEQQLMMTRRHFFGLSSLGIGTAALVSLLTESGRAMELPQSLPQGGDQKVVPPSCRISLRRRKELSTCFKPEALRSSICLIRNRTLKSFVDRICPHRFARANV